MSKEDIDFLAARINHMAWFLKLEKDGKDLYPAFRASLEKPEYYVNEKVRGEVARQFGCFVTESSGHLSDYLPRFRKNRTALDLYCDQPGLGGETGFSHAFAKLMEEKFGSTDYLKQKSGKLEARSVDYCSHNLEALVTGRYFLFQGNVMNKGNISNLPQDCCVEVPVFVDENGLHPVAIGRLPGPLGAMDPLTSPVLTLKEIRNMTTEMLDAQEKYLPKFGKKRPRIVPTVSIPPGTSGVDVPLDPALAMANRFGKLFEST